MNNIETIKENLKNLYLQREQLDKQIKLLETQLEKTINNRFILKDAIYLDKTNFSKQLLQELEDLATFDNPQIKILLSLRKPLYNTPKKIKSFSYDDKKNLLILPRGLMRDVIKVLQKYNINSSYEDLRFVKKEKFDDVCFTLREDQQEAIENITKKDFCLAVAPPGFGKTLLGAKMIYQRSVNTLVIVHKNMLLDQWIDRFMTYFQIDKKSIGYLGKGKNKLNNKLDIATIQSLKNNPDIIKNYSFVIVDECHHIPAVTFEKIIKIYEGKYILGLSATPNRKDGMQPLIFQQLGNIAYEAKKKITFNNKLKIVTTNFQSQADNFTDLLSELINDEQRNDIIIQQIQLYKNRKILLLTDRIEHIENLSLLLEAKDIDFITIHGSLTKSIQSKNMLQISTANLVLATTSFFGEGIDFPHLDTIILATPISYYGRLVQYLGRIGRGGKDSLAIDILDNKNRFTLSAYKKRKEGYKQLHYKQMVE
jgi:superfamily II DNA or RNA helicase